MSSRESDSAYPPPRQGGNRPQPGGREVPPGRRQGPGPDAYPSGTPPYGTGLPNGFDAPTGPGTRPVPQQGAARSGAADGDDVPKTETTLTTRVRINIPGSRPIPPVVVRSPVKTEEPPAEPTGPRHRSGASSSPVLGVVDSGAQGARAPQLPPEWQQSEAESESESTGEWFKPRQKGRQDVGPAPVPAGSTGPRPAASAQPSPAARQSQGLQAQERPGSGEARPAAGPRPTGAPASPFAGGAPGRRAAEGRRPGAADDPFAGQDTGTVQRPGFGAGLGGRAGGPISNDPFAADPFASGQGPTDPFANGQGPTDPFAGGQGPTDPFAGGQGPTDPFAGGQGPTGPFAGGRRAGRRSEPPRAAGQPEDTQIGGFEPVRDDFASTAAIPGLPTGDFFGSPAPAASGVDPFAPNRPGASEDPFAPNRQGNAAQDPFGTPQDPFATGQPPRGRFADVSYEPAPPFPGSLGGAAPTGSGGSAGPAEEPGHPGGPARESVPPGTVRPGHVRPDPENETPETEVKPAAKPRKRRASKLAVYGVGGVLFAGAAAYGTGLMLNQADIPKGTTVLGTDIGGDARDQALSLLDGSVGKVGQRPVKLKIGDQAVNLDPATAGLSFDTTATVDALTKHSYSPVEVISSLTGGSKAVAPEVKVDRAKLKAALEALGAKSGQGLQEGFVRFTADGQTEVVPGKAGQAVDATAAMDQIEQAYRNRAAGQDDSVLTMPVTAAQPKVSADDLKAAADGLGKSVLNGNVTVFAGTVKFAFGKVTASQALTLAPDATGKIVLKWDLDKLNDALKGVFDKSKIKKNGALSPITPQDVADGIASVLDKTAAKDRVFHFPTA